MSAYATKLWPTNSHSPLSGEAHPLYQTSETNGRDYPSESGENSCNGEKGYTEERNCNGEKSYSGEKGYTGESTCKQNGVGEVQCSHRQSPVLWGSTSYVDHQQAAFYLPHSYSLHRPELSNYSRMEMDGRQSHHLNYSSSNSNQSYYLDRTYVGAQSDFSQYQNGTSDNRVLISTLPGSSYHYNNSVTLPYTHPIAEWPFGHFPQHQNPLLITNNERLRFNQFARYRPPFTQRVGRSSHQTVPNKQKRISYLKRLTLEGQPVNEQEEHPINDHTDHPLEAPNDPRLHRKEVESNSPAASQSILSVSTLDSAHKQQNASVVEQLTKEHSYFQKRTQDSSVEAAKEETEKPKQKVSNISSSSVLSPLSTKCLTTGVVDIFNSLFVEALADLMKSNSEQISVTESCNKVVDPSKPPTQAPQHHNVWPVPKDFSLDDYSLELNSDVDSGSDEEMSYLNTKRKPRCNNVVKSVDSSGHGASPSAESLTSDLSSQVASDSKSTTCLSSNQQSHLSFSIVSRGSSLTSHDTMEADEDDQTAGRRSKKSVSSSGLLEDLPSAGDVSVSSCEGGRVANNRKQKKNHSGVDGVPLTRRRSMRTRLGKGAVNSTNSQKIQKLVKKRDVGGVSTELKKLLVAGKFPSEILAIRSRGELIALARRTEMEKEMEQHEKERIQTSREEINPEEMDTEYPSLKAVPNLSEIADDVSSEISITLTTSSNQTIMQDQASVDLDQFSVRSSDSLLDEFSPDLVARCKRINTVRSSGDTPLHKVSRSGKFEMARYFLLVEKANPNKADNAGWTPLHEACCNNRALVVELLLQNGACANVSSRDGTRPIHDAIEIGSLEIVKLLIKYGADPMADLGDKTPLEFSKSLEQTGIHEYILSVIKERQDRVSSQNVTLDPLVAKASIGTSRPPKPPQTSNDSILTIPVSGYSSGDPHFGAELDYPLFYVCPVLELSETPIIPVYNFEIVSGPNSRRHNFYILSDLLKALDMNETELRQHCSEIFALELTVGEVIKNLKHPYYNGHVTLPASISSCSKSTKVKFLPLCSKLRNLLDIKVVSLDD